MKLQLLKSPRVDRILSARGAGSGRVALFPPQRVKRISLVGGCRLIGPILVIVSERIRSALVRQYCDHTKAATTGIIRGLRLKRAIFERTSRIRLCCLACSAFPVREPPPSLACVLRGLFLPVFALVLHDHRIFGNKTPWRSRD
jgi:hypothetical protein